MGADRRTPRSEVSHTVLDLAAVQGHSVVLHSQSRSPVGFSARRPGMKITVMGSGGVGGYFGARLAAAGNDVTFVARGTHLAAMRKSGLRLDSEIGKLHLDPVKVVADAREIAAADAIIFAVKMGRHGKRRAEFEGVGRQGSGGLHVSERSRQRRAHRPHRRRQERRARRRAHRCPTSPSLASSSRRAPLPAWNSPRATTRRARARRPSTRPARARASTRSSHPISGASCG